MGQEIVYCFKCLTRLTGGDFEKGKAFRSGLKVSCKDCLPELLSGLTPEERKRFQEPPKAREPQGISSTRIGALRPTTTRRRLEDEPTARRGRGKGLALGLGGGAVVLLAAGLLLLRPKPGEPPPATSPPRVVETPKAPPENPRRKAAQEAIAKARAGPADLDARLALWAEAVRAAQGTDLLSEAFEAEQALLRQRSSAYRKEIEALDAEARPVLARGEHAKAAEVYDRAKAKRPDAEWGRLLSDKAAELRREAERVYESLKARALEAARQGKDAEAKALEDQVAKLGYPGLSAELRRELDATKPAEPPKAEAPPSAELLAYRDAWRRAVALAAARDFAAAAADLERAAKDLKEDVSKLEAKRDLEDVVRIGELHAEAVKLLGASTPGREVSAEILDDEGARKRVQGRIVRVGTERAELAGEPLTVLEFADLSAGGIAEVVGRARKLAVTDRRALGFLGLAEGDAKGAEALFSAFQVKYRDLAKDAAVRPPQRPPAEREARRLLYQADREYADAATRAQAVAKYRRLLAEHPSAKAWKADADLVRRRAEEGKETFVGVAAFRTGGTFRPGKSEKIESCWTSVEDTEAEKAVENFAEFEFVATAETAYRAWVHVAGCCAEVFAFSWQATELAGPNPKKPSETVQAAPEGPNHLPVRHGVLYLKSKHGDHLGPKSPKRWAWVPLPLPKYATSGLKRVRVLTNQKGFSVAYAVVSSTRSTPPNDADLRELAGRSKSSEPLVDPALIGWWRLDEKSGTAAAEASGKAPAGEFREGAAWAAGKLGGAAQFADKGFVTVPDFAFSGAAISASVWVRHDQAGGTQRYVTMGSESFLLRSLADDDLHFLITTDGQHRSLHADRAIAAGTWIHVVGTWDGTTQKLYKDGALVASGKPGGTLAPFKRLQISSGGEGMKGQLDDVRVYARALTEADVQSLYAAGLAGGPSPAPEGRPWQPVWDGKTTAFLGGGSENFWKVEDGLLVRPPGGVDSAQSREQFGDGEFRIRFEASGGASARFSFRQGGGGTYTVFVNDPSLPGKPHELVVTCRGDQVKATLNGQAAAVEASGSPARGHLQFGFSRGALRIHSVEMRPLP